MNVVPGLVLDQNGQILVVVKCDISIAVSIKRYATIEAVQNFRADLKKERWTLVFRALSDNLLVSTKDQSSLLAMSENASAEEKESGQFAIELALDLWPEWGGDFRERYKPRPFVPYWGKSNDQYT